MNELEKLFAQKRTENGDKAYSTSGSKLLDLLFMTSYFEKHLGEVKIGDSEKEKLFAMFIRDGRYGLGRRDLGRELMKQAKVGSENVVKAGRFDDLYLNPTDENLAYLKRAMFNGNELAKKWLPRLSCKHKRIAKILCKMWGISEKKYRKLIKCDTTENKLSHHRIDEIELNTISVLCKKIDSQNILKA